MVFVFIKSTNLKINRIHKNIEKYEKLICIFSLGVYICIMKNEINIMKNYNIRKSYEGSPSKNNNNYEQGLSYGEAIAELDSLESSWKRNGGMIISRTEDVLVVEESDGSETITFEIYEA